MEMNILIIRLSEHDKEQFKNIYKSKNTDLGKEIKII